jgi:hypothetical protein
MGPAIRFPFRRIMLWRPRADAKITATVSGRSRCFCRCPKDMTRAGRIAGVSCAFADRNSLLAGNLAGYLQNPTEFKPFRLPARLIAPRYQEVGGQFPAPGRPRTSAGKQGVRSKGHRCKDMGVQGHSVLAARTWVQGHRVLGARMGHCQARDSARSKRAIGTAAPKQGPLICLVG